MLEDFIKAYGVSHVRNISNKTYTVQIQGVFWGCQSIPRVLHKVYMSVINMVSSSV